MSRSGSGFLLGTVALLIVLTPGMAEDAKLLTGKAAMGDWTGDAPGVRRKITVADLPTKELIRRRGRSEVEPEHMTMRDQHRGPQPPRDVFQARADQFLGGPSVAGGQRDFERVRVIARGRRYDRSPLYDSHFRPAPFSMRG